MQFVNDKLKALVLVFPFFLPSILFSLLWLSHWSIPPMNDFYKTSPENTVLFIFTVYSISPTFLLVISYHHLSPLSIDFQIYLLEPAFPLFIYFCPLCASIVKPFVFKSFVWKKIRIYLESDHHNNTLINTINQGPVYPIFLPILPVLFPPYSNRP